ncbi:MAG: sodium:solute symporter family protein, partial [Bacillota bacterium]|nr:sodium:solute symporter family protein [Bacillota bacterium]
LTLSMTSIKYPSALTFVLLFSTALVLGNNYYWIKIASCRSEKVGRNSFVLAGLFLIVVFFIPLTLIGAYAGAVMPQAFTLGGGAVPPTAAYGAFAKLFPPVLSSLFIVGAVAASISTASTATIGATSTATRDIYQRLIAPGADPKKSLKASKIIMILVGVMTWILTFFPGGPTYLFAFANAWLVPPAILLIFGMIWPRFNETGALGGVIAGIITMAVLTLTDLLKIFTVSTWTHLAIVGLVVTLVFGVIFTFFGKPKYYGASGWNVKVSGGNRQSITPSAQEVEVLKLIAVGHGYMSDITDALGVDSKTSSEIIARLDQGGLIERAGLFASSFYQFHLTEAGELIAESHMNDNEKKFARKGLTPQYAQMMQLVESDPHKLPAFVKEQQWKSLKVSSVTSHLSRVGYVAEKGLYKRRLELTEQGRKALTEVGS